MGYFPYSPQTSAIYTLQTGQWRAVFNDPFDPYYAGMLTEVAGLDSPDIRESAEDLVEADGGIHGNFYFGRRPVTLNGSLFGHASASERDAKLDLIRNATMAMRSDTVLSWVPRDRVANYIKNPRALGGLTHWTAYASVGSTGQLADPAASGYVSGFRLTSTLNTVGHVTGLYQTTPYSYIDPRGNTVTPASPYRAGSGSVSPGDESVTVSAAITVISAPLNSNAKLRLKIRALDYSGSYLGESAVDTFTLNAASTGEITLAGSLPASSLPVDTSSVSIQVTVGEAAVTGTIVTRIDKLALDIRRDGVVPEYIDGGLDGGYWWGDPYDSPSGNYLPMELTLRRQQPLRITGGWVKDFQMQMVAANPQILSPISRSAQINIGDWKQIENYGNAAYYPLVDVYGPLNYWSEINGAGNVLKIINPTYSATGYMAATQAGTLDTLRHTFKTPTGSSYDMHVNWSEVVDWPKVNPFGSFWTLTNGSTGANTGGYIIVKSRDAWV